MAAFPAGPRLAGSLLFLFSCFGAECFGISGTDFLWAVCLSCHPTNSVTRFEISLHVEIAQIWSQTGSKPNSITLSWSREIDSFGWYNDTVKNSSITTKHLYLILTFRSHHEIFIRRSWYSVLPSLDATISCRIKKAVVGVTQLITALVSIHGSMTFHADMYSFLDPPGRTVLFSVDDRSLFPVDCVIGLIRMIGEC